MNNFIDDKLYFILTIKRKEIILKQLIFAHVE